MKNKMTDEELVLYVLSAKERGEKYRDDHEEDIAECIKHYDCVHPEAWKKKPAWQSKIYVPNAYKNVEVASSMLVKMLFSQKDFFEIEGFEEEETEIRDELTKLVVHLLQKGNFYNVGALALKEACKTSVCFIKTVDESKGKDYKLSFVPRTFHDMYVDPSITTRWTSARFIVDEYEKDVSEILDKDIYKYGKKYFDEIKEHTQKSEAKEKRQAIDEQGENAEDVTYKPHTLLEFYGQVKDPETLEDEYMLLVVVDGKWLIRKEIIDVSPYDVIRVNADTTQFYGNGIIRKTIELENLMNGCVNLWFDNWKLSVMKMFAVDPDAAVKWDSIKFEPAAIWEVAKGALQPIEFGMNVDGLTMMTVLDQIIQEVTGISKVAQGQSAPSTDETLGEIQLKLSRAESRFIQMAKFIEAEFLNNFIKKIVNYIIDTCPQSYVDKVLGYKKVERKIPANMLGVVADGVQNFINKVFKVQRLDMADLKKRKNSEGLTLDFHPIGISRFSNKAEEQQKYEKLLAAVLSSEQLQIMVDVKKLFKKTLLVSGFEDINFMRDDEQIEAMSEQIHQMNSVMNMAQMGQQSPQAAAPMQEEIPQ